MNKTYVGQMLAIMTVVVVMAVCALNQLSSGVGMKEVGFENLSSNSMSRKLVTAGDPLRIAVFGSSHSWGATLEDRFNAYPYRLSPRVDNFAYFASGK